MGKLPIRLKIFFVSIYIITIVSLMFFFKTDLLNFNSLTTWKNIIFFAVLAFFTETFTVGFRNISFSTTFAITIACYLLFGITSTVLVIFIGYTFRIIKIEDKKYKHILNTALYGTIFNYCILILPKLYGHYFYINYGGGFEISKIYLYLPQLFLFCLISFFLNNLIISILTSLKFKKNIFYSFMSNSKLAGFNYIIMAPLGILLAIIFTEYSYFGVLILMFPIVLARYTFSLYIDAKSQYVETVNSFMYAMEAKDKYTQGHSRRVADISKMIGKELGYSEWKLEQLYVAALLHDIGKIGIEDNILNKPGKLTEEEFNIIKNHTNMGYSIIKDIKNLKYASDIVLHHHERYDGFGYPEKIKGEDLNVDAFIVQLADSVDAMSTDRPYRKALDQEHVVEEIKNNTGTQFHPKVVKAYFDAVKKNNI